MLNNSEKEILGCLVAVKKKNYVLYNCQNKSINHGDTQHKGDDINGYIEYVCEEKKLKISCNS